MRRAILIVGILLCLAGCSTTTGTVDSVQYEPESTVIKFTDGRIYKSSNKPDVSVMPGDRITIEYMDSTTYKGQIDIYHIRHEGVLIKAEDANMTRPDLIICPRCQYSLKKGQDYQ